MSRTDAHRPFEVADRLEGREVVSTYGGETFIAVELPRHEQAKHFGASDAAGEKRRNLNSRERLAARRSLRAGDFDALAPRWSARGQVRY